MKKVLETTPTLCAQELAELDPQTATYWLARDAANAHTLLALVKTLAGCLGTMTRYSDWQSIPEPDDLAVIDARAAIDAAQEWIGEA